MVIPLNNITVDRLNDPLFTEKEVIVSIARLDKIHPEVSGNKLFKLHFFIEECLRSDHKTILTYGGAFSNHLAATAFFCGSLGIKCIGVVRGEEPRTLSHTLVRCRDAGMQLHFISREAYKAAESLPEISALEDRFGNFTRVPEGGYSPIGAAGAALIPDLLSTENATHICTAVGTATTVAGLLMKSIPGQEIIAVPVIKNMADIRERLAYLTGNPTLLPEIFSEYHFGGYAKYTPGLLSFMNKFYSTFGIPTDYIYTAKMMYAVTEKIKQGYFKPGSRIVCLHTGGLQGNRSLPSGSLIFP
ncbi:MAG: pyridoxal-phosphate dependent enzyme [Ferruginibacter sp.]